MKKIALLSILALCGTLGTSAYTVTLSCTKVQTISPDSLPAGEWEEYIRDLEEIYCGSGSHPDSGMHPENPDNPPT